jgi:hypothetical protein
MAIAMKLDIIDCYLRNAHARQVVAGFAATLPSLDVLWEQVHSALDDVPTLGSAVSRLATDLASARLDRANLIAAIRAALAAQADGDEDPLSYLRDELAEQAGDEAPGGEQDD